MIIFSSMMLIEIITIHLLKATRRVKKHLRGGWKENFHVMLCYYVLSHIPPPLLLQLEGVNFLSGHITVVKAVQLQFLFLIPSFQHHIQIPTKTTEIYPARV